MNASAICHGTLGSSTQPDRLKDVTSLLESTLPLPPLFPTKFSRARARRALTEDGSAFHASTSALIPRGREGGGVFLKGKGSPPVAVLLASQPTAEWVE